MRMEWSGIRIQTERQNFVFFFSFRIEGTAHTIARIHLVLLGVREFEEFIQHTHMRAHQTTETKINGPIMSSNFILFCYDEIIPVSRETDKRNADPCAGKCKRHEDNTRNGKWKGEKTNDEHMQVNEKRSDVLRCGALCAVRARIECREDGAGWRWRRRWWRWHSLNCILAEKKQSLNSHDKRVIRAMSDI